MDGSSVTPAIDRVQLPLWTLEELTSADCPALLAPATNLDNFVLVTAEGRSAIMLDSRPAGVCLHQLDGPQPTGNLVRGIALDPNRATAFRPSRWRLPPLSVIEHPGGVALVVLSDHRRFRRRKRLVVWQGQPLGSYAAATGYHGWSVVACRCDERVPVYIKVSSSERLLHNVTSVGMIIAAVVGWIAVLLLLARSSLS